MTDSGERTRRMRDRLTRHEPSVCHERAAIVTEVYGRLAGAFPPILLRAHALAAVLDGMSIFIGPDELVVGNQASRPRAAFNGTLLNIKLSPQSVAGESGLENLVALIRTYFQLGGQHVQFNVIDSAVLRDAQRHPDQYGELVVRVAGFSVLFTTIDWVLQEDIIERTELRV